ncbi:MAG: helix-turn-helix transcriptional regulator [Halobacteriovoraceae bacterium]|nr:helix-turn-helix transcriptional regulator [Halobacteriovoraceae bacterium]
MQNNDLIVYKNAEDFAKDMGLSEVEIALVKEKIKLIEKLKAKRIKKRLSQAALAKKIDSKQPAIARMESGLISQISMDFLIKAAMVLGVPYKMQSKLAA